VRTVYKDLDAPDLLAHDVWLRRFRTKTVTV